MYKFPPLKRQRNSHSSENYDRKRLLLGRSLPLHCGGVLMSDYSALKRLAEAAKRNQHDYEALNDYGVAASPAAILALIADNDTPGFASKNWTCSLALHPRHALLCH
jgi:hypothetical protein